MDDNIKQLLQLCEGEFGSWSRSDNECYTYYCKFCGAVCIREKDIKHNARCAVLKFQEIKERIVK